MATGPDHYREAERLLRGLEIVGHPTQAQVHQTQMAQVHATLALAAATALNDFEGGMSAPDYNTWMGVAGVNGTETAAG